MGHLLSYICIVKHVKCINLKHFKHVSAGTTPASISFKPQLSALNVQFKAEGPQQETRLPQKKKKYRTYPEQLCTAGQPMTGIKTMKQPLHQYFPPPQTSQVNRQRHRLQSLSGVSGRWCNGVFSSCVCDRKLIKSVFWITQLPERFHVITARNFVSGPFAVFEKRLVSLLQGILCWAHGPL